MEEALGLGAGFPQGNEFGLTRFAEAGFFAIDSENGHCEAHDVEKDLFCNSDCKLTFGP